MRRTEDRGWRWLFIQASNCSSSAFSSSFSSSVGIDGFVGRAEACTPSSSLDFKALSVNMKEAMLHVMRGDKMLRLVSPTPTHYHCLTQEVLHNTVGV